MRKVNITDVFTNEMIHKASHYISAKNIKDNVIIPHLEEINRITGQENDPMYLAYLMQYVLSKLGVYDGKA